MCFYGDHLSSQAWETLDLAIVDPDNFSLPTGSGPIRLAYVSAGEADERRAYWSSVSSKPFLVEPNPDWPGAHRVDMRDPEWRGLLVKTVAPAALGRGYQGVMLDTLDVAEYLESSAPARFAGSLDAAAALVRELRAAAPSAIILVNNALPLLDKISDDIDGVVVEDVYSRCLPAEPCRPTPPAETRAKEEILRRFARRTGKPVFVLLYAHLGERGARWVQKAARRSKASGFLPYLADPSLERLGVPDPGGGR